MNIVGYIASATFVLSALAAFTGAMDSGSQDWLLWGGVGVVVSLVVLDWMDRRQGW